MKTSVLIIGGGFMGVALAKYFNKYDIKSYLFDKDPSVVSKHQENNELEGIEVIQKIEEADPLKIKFIIEAVPEKLKIKQSLFAEIESKFNNDAIFCTNTSSLLISEIGKKMINKNRLIGTHYFSPADITPLVEVIPSSDTSQVCIEEVVLFLEKIDKKPILIKKEIPGFVANRLQTALAREAISLVEQGVVTAEELDYIAKWSLGIRMANTGPLEQRDINGIDSHYEIAKYVYPTLDNSLHPLETHKHLMEREMFGIKTLSGFYKWDETKITSQLKKKEKVIKSIISLLGEK